jgi:AraC-like DNA-binding protein
MRQLSSDSCQVRADPGHNAAMPPRRPARPLPVGDTDDFRPTPSRPVRLRARNLPADTHFAPHAHPWAQLASCARGVLEVTVEPEGGDAVTCIVPPSRAVWIAPGARHAVHVLEEAEFRTLYLHASVTPAGWQGCRVLVVPALLREAVAALEAPQLDAARERLLSDLVLDELRRAAPAALGVPLPPAGGDKRLRALCEAVLRDPSSRLGLAGWAREVGASERTLARLFREELGTGWQPWRQQVVLAHALPLLARGVPVSEVAAATGYASESAFSAMFKAALGQPPRGFQGRRAA